MKYHVMTLFPEMIEQGLNCSIIGRALREQVISLETVNIRDYTHDRHHKVDDYTYGGGAGMLMKAQPVWECCEDIISRIPGDHTRRVIYVTPQGRPFTQKMAQEFASCDDLIFLCGHYEGIDERVIDEIVTDPVSIGDYVLTGGELPAMVMIDAISRLVDGVLGNDSSAETESFHGGLLEYPQYTRPEEWHGRRVPDVLIGGDQKSVDAWRLEEAVKRTRERRPDLYQSYMRIAMIRKLLAENRRDYPDLINLIDSGCAELISRAGGCILMRDAGSHTLYFVNLDPALLSSEDFLMKIYEMTGDALVQSATCLVVHQTEDEVAITNVFELTDPRRVCMAVYAPKEQLSAARIRRAFAGDEVNSALTDFVENGINEAIRNHQIPYVVLPAEVRPSIHALQNLGVYASHSDQLVYRISQVK